MKQPCGCFVPGEGPGLWPDAACKASPNRAVFLVVQMARHEHLPIYKAALDLTVQFEKLVAGVSRHYK